jgi:membrane-bound ClpP family serine protease
MTGEESSGALLGAILLGVAAFGIFFLEFVLPTGGLLAVLCVLCAVASVTLAFMHDATLGMTLLALYGLAAPFMLMLGLRMATKSKVGRMMVLSAEDPARTGARIADELRIHPALGARGEAITPLRPAGFVRIDGKRLDATAEGDFVDAGSAIEVAAVRDGQLRVRLLNAANPTTID